MAIPEALPPLDGPGGTAAPSGRVQDQPLGEPDPLAAARTASFAAALSEAELALLAQATSGEAAGQGSTNPLVAELPLLLFGALQPSSALAGGPQGATAALTGVAPTAAVGDLGGSVGERIVRIAESQVGQHEEPLGSNEGTAIATYRSATRGAIPGAPWCAYFVSWVARQAGVPLGAEGQGFGAVAEIWEWAQQTGRAIPNGPGVVPKPGDLILFGDQHVGIVRRVLPDGKLETIEGNYENKVALNTRSESEPTGYVEL